MLVPYRGTGPAMNDVIGGHVDFFCEQVVSVAAAVKGGTIKAYGISNKEGSPALPGVPSASAAGAPQYVMSIWSAIFAPRGTPKEAVAKLADALNKTLDDPVIGQKLVDLGGTVPAKSERGPAKSRHAFEERDRALGSDPARGRDQDQLMLDRESQTDADRQMHARARAIAEAGGIEAALRAGALPKLIETTLAEALVLGLLKQGVRKYLAIFGHGSTELGDVLRVYEEEGVTRTFNCRNEVAMAHAATALRWQYGETPAVVTSIGPGALQAFAGSLASASNGVGVYHIYGDETTFGEGYNMQQIPKEEQGLFGQHDRADGPFLRATHAGSVARCVAARCACGQSSISRRAVLSAAAAQHPAAAAHDESRGLARAAETSRAGAGRRRDSTRR